MSKIACIGAGYWGKNLIRNFHELGHLHSICDNNAEILEKFKKQHPQVQCTTSYSDILQNKEIDGIVVATPAVLHYQYAKEALLNGKDLFVEKPLAMTAEEGNHLVRLADENSRILMVGHLLEYHPAILKIKQLIDNGELGKIYYIYSNRLNLGKIRTEENILWSFAPHDIAVMILLLNKLPVEVSCNGGSYLHHDIADVTMTEMKFASGVRGHIFVSWLHPFKEQKLVIVGEKKMIVFNDTAESDKLLLYSHKIEWINKIPLPHKEKPLTVDFEQVEPLKAECQHFIQCIQNRTTPKTDGRKGVDVLEILESAQKSLMAGGKKISIKSKQKNTPTFFADTTAVIDEQCEIGEGSKIWHFSHIMKNAKIGKGCNIGQNVLISPEVTIGNNVKIQNNVSVYTGVTLEDDVFCGPSMVFTNIINPRSHIPRKSEYKSTVVKKGATLGANCTIVCGATIGKHAFIGAGAVVTKDVSDYALVYGNPAVIKGWICSCGVKLEFDNNINATCTACAKKFEKKNDMVLPVKSA